MSKYDTNEPILVLVRRGRRGRGFSISPVEDIASAAICADEKEIGEVIVEMLDDENQPRVNINDLLNAATEPPPRSESEPEDEDDDDEDDDEDDEDEGDAAEGTIFEGVAGSEDPADRLLFNIFSSVVRKGQSMSSRKVHSTGRSRGRKKKKKK